jgi:CRISPR-associated protein Csh2
MPHFKKYQEVKRKMSEELPNSEILLLYEAKLCNPNGDPDAENKPRIDPKTGINIVTDLRLKRFFRDYIAEKYGEDFIYVTKVGGESVTAESRLERLLGRSISKNDVPNVLKRCIDARLFGATIPIGKGEKERGESASCTGPVQFGWGFSLHKVELVDSSAITSVFSGREAAAGYGTIGRDWRVWYSLISFYGVVSGRRAKETIMSREDLKLFDNLLWTALQVQPTTRSKIGEMPHLYLRIEYTDADTVLGDLRKYIKVEAAETVRDLQDLKISFDGLTEHVKRNIDKISQIYIRTSDEMTHVVGLLEKASPGKVFRLPHELDVRAVLERCIKA